MEAAAARGAAAGAQIEAAGGVSGLAAAPADGTHAMAVCGYLGLEPLELREDLLGALDGRVDCLRQELTREIECGVERQVEAVLQLGSPEW
eukprot:SAG11_NODE_34778_length_270_cov_0.608187_1_plen_90_part_11